MLVVSVSHSALCLAGIVNERLGREAAERRVRSRDISSASSSLLCAREPCSLDLLLFPCSPSFKSHGWTSSLSDDMCILFVACAACASVLTACVSVCSRGCARACFGLFATSQHFNSEKLALGLKPRQTHVQRRVQGAEPTRRSSKTQRASTTH